MKTQKRLYGDAGETLSVSLLAQKGYKILARNFWTRLGEIDIIAKDGDTVVFVEVKRRSSCQYGSPAEAVTKEKLRKIIKTAQLYLIESKQTRCAWRVDVIAVDAISVRHFMNVTL